MTLIFENPTLSEEALNFLNEIATIKITHRIDIEREPAVLVSIYHLDFIDEKQILCLTNKNQQGIAYQDYYYNGLKILHISENETENWVSTTNLRKASETENPDEEAIAFLNYLDDVNHVEYDKKLRKNLMQLAMLIAGSETGFQHSPILSNLRALKKEDPNRHDKIINGDYIYKELYELIPNWGPKVLNLRQIRAMDTGAGVSGIFVQPQSTIQYEYDPSKFTVPPKNIDEAIPDDNVVSPGLTSQEVQDKASLIWDLQKYIARIERSSTSKIPNFRHGFWFMQDTRAANRKANYHLAKQLVNKLMYETNLSIHEIFDDIKGQRDSIIMNPEIFRSTRFPNRGINSSELNAIIKKAQKLDPPPPTACYN